MSFPQRIVPPRCEVTGLLVSYCCQFVGELTGDAALVVSQSPVTYRYYDYYCMFSAVATITNGSSYPEGEVVLPRKRGEHLQLINSYIYILWLLLHVFSRCDYDLPQVAIIIHNVVSRNSYMILWLLLHVFSSGDFDFPKSGVGQIVLGESQSHINPHIYICVPNLVAVRRSCRKRGVQKHTRQTDKGTLQLYTIDDYLCMFK